MPHYVLHLDDEKPDRYAVYSTVVDNLLTVPMTPRRMKNYLANRDYDSWLKPYDAEEVIREWGNGWSDGMKRLMHDQAPYFYWHEAGFCYAKLSDAYFCLPRCYWRYD
jgi:hypothetical protein